MHAGLRDFKLTSLAAQLTSKLRKNSRCGLNIKAYLMHIIHTEPHFD